MIARGATTSLRRTVVRLNRPLNLVGQDSASPLNRKRIGLLGGSFNPAHEGHRTISLEAIRRLGLDQVWWLVSPQNPLKPSRGMADLRTRLSVAEQVVGRHPKLMVTDLEQRLGTRYTVDTVRVLLRNGRASFVWLIGADNLVQMPEWRSWRQLINLVPIAVFDREPYSYRALAGRVARAFAARRIRVRDASRLVRAHPPAWVYFRLRRHRASSTAIRSRSIWPPGSRAGLPVLAKGGQKEGTSS